VVLVLHELELHGVGHQGHQGDWCAGLPARPLGPWLPTQPAGMSVTGLNKKERNHNKVCEPSDTGVFWLNDRQLFSNQSKQVLLAGCS
jgi:hypothetical protein